MGSEPRGRHDNGLFLAVCVLASLGLVMVYSVSYAYASSHGRNPEATLMRQLLALTAGLIACGTLAHVRLVFLRSLAWWLLLPSLGLLVAVQIPGVVDPGSQVRRFLPLGHGLAVQPSVMAAVALVVVLARIGAVYSAAPERYDWFVLWSLAVLGVTCALIVVGPNLSTTVIVLVTGLVMMYVAGAKPKHLAASVGAASLAASAVALSTPYMRQRVADFLAHASGGEPSYQVKHCLIALGAGGWFGRGLCRGVEKYGYLPEVHNDTIFAAIGEEMGLAVTLTIVALYAWILVRGYRIARTSRTPFGRYLACGITTLIAFQASVNMLVVTGTIPTTGVPLPFVSAGGTSIAVFMAAAGMLLAASRECVHDGQEVLAADATRLGEWRNGRPRLPSTSRGGIAAASQWR